MIFYFIAFLAILITGFSQILLKIGSIKNKNKKNIKLFLNIHVFIGYFLFIIVTLLNLYVFKYLPIKFNIVLIPISIVNVFILSVIILKEKISKNKIIGGSIVLLGVIIFNI
ncbi:MAG: hypothetical protein A2015_03150 [Spirochaetes bacterium GWF1_31_7]|nr:MAG: hypothetical protein A2Y30_16610 [Spirochaetes bacterium GWE1_32_154]OHD50964.1 MAG: hypothetical protein A2015_03150 [Spirochaetes bacterium GWF1_31_7]OHD51122.1 MAG: hypothetical protein A2Y29_10980 [Spirochaetes bacterium GWE2_31_10]